MKNQIVWSILMLLLILSLTFGMLYIFPPEVKENSVLSVEDKDIKEIKALLNGLVERISCQREIMNFQLSRLSDIDMKLDNIDRNIDNTLHILSDK